VNGNDRKDDFEILNQERFYSYFVRLYVSVEVRDNVSHCSSNVDCEKISHKVSV